MTQAKAAATWKRFDSKRLLPKTAGPLHLNRIYVIYALMRGGLDGLQRQAR